MHKIIYYKLSVKTTEDKTINKLSNDIITTNTINNSIKKTSNKKKI